MCGADLERLRRRPLARLSSAIRTSTLPGRSSELVDYVLLTIVLLIVALFAPAYGIALALLVGWDRNRRRHRTGRNTAVICLFLAVASFFTPLVPSLPRLEPVWQQHKASTQHKKSRHRCRKRHHQLRGANAGGSKCLR